MPSWQDELGLFAVLNSLFVQHVTEQRAAVAALLRDTNGECISLMLW